MEDISRNEQRAGDARADIPDAGGNAFRRELDNIFIWMHQHPELSFEEYQTTGQIRRTLTDHGIEILESGLKTGLIAVVRGGQDGPVQALRCDIDALPVTESSGLPYASLTPGKMHACGHDFHITAGLGAAILLHARRGELKGTVKFLFQPGEELSAGAEKVIATGLTGDVSRFWGIHATPAREVMELAISPGYVAASAERFAIRIKGAGCHGAYPHTGIDPVPAACAIVQALQTIPSRNANAYHQTLISVTHIDAGTTWNVVPETAFLEGTIRTFDQEDRALYKRRMDEIVKGTAAAFQVEAGLSWVAGAPAVDNDPRLAELAARAAAEEGFTVVPAEQSMAGDDFSLYGELAPSCYIRVGTGRGPQIHHPDLVIDRRALVPTARYLARLLLDGGAFA